jgi:hypothetical protein
MLQISVDWDKKNLQVSEVSSSTRNQPVVRTIVTIAGKTYKGTNMAFQMMLGGLVAAIALSPKTLSGISAPVEGVTFSSSNPEVASVDAAGIVTTVSVGITTISISADALIGEGVVTITDTLEIEVTPELAATLNPTITLVEPA